eukprot:358862-Chlamydomonas_euryale.AAC.3
MEREAFTHMVGAWRGCMTRIAPTQGGTSARAFADDTWRSITHAVRCCAAHPQPRSRAPSASTLPTATAAVIRTRSFESSSSLSLLSRCLLTPCSPHRLGGGDWIRREGPHKNGPQCRASIARARRPHPESDRVGPPHRDHEPLLGSALPSLQAVYLL